MYHKTFIRFGFRDILNNQLGLGKCYQPGTSARVITLTSTLIIPDITKTSSNNYLISCHRARVDLTPDIFQVHCYITLRSGCLLAVQQLILFFGDIKIGL